MNNPTIYFVCAVLAAAACNLFTRAFPFIMFSKSEKLPDFALYLGRYLPPCVMAVLVVYCLKGISFSSAAGFIPLLASSLAVLLLHLWKRNSLISIAGGTLLYMVLVQVVFS